MPPEIFASYSREDQAQVFPIVDKLRERGLNIWIDQEGIHGAKLWSQEIVNAIESSKVFILFASAKAFVSKNVTKELALASESDKHILPIFIEEAEIPAAMKYQLAGIQHLVHEQGQTEQTADNILRTLGNLEIQSTEPEPTVGTTAPTTKSASKAPLVAAALVIALLAFIFVFKSSTPTNENPAATQPEAKQLDKNRIVVLPFKNIGTSGENDHIVEGIVDDLNTMLSKVDGLKVIGSVSAKTYKGSDMSPSEIGQELNTGTLIQGSIQKAGEELKINVKLIDVNSGEISWAESYNGNETERFALQSQIVKSVGKNLDGIVIDESKINDLKKSGTTNPKAYDLVQRAKILLFDGNSKASTKKAVELYEQAVQLDPDYASAYAGLGKAHYYTSTTSIETPRVAFSKSKAAYEKALKLDPKNSMALAGMSDISLFLDRDLKKSKQLLDLAYNPESSRSEVIRSYTLYLESRGRFREMAAATLKGIEYDPKSPKLHQVYAWVNYYLGNLELADKHSKIALSLSPSFQWALHLRSIILIDSGKFREAESMLIQGIKDDPNNPVSIMSLGVVYWKWNKKRESESLLLDLLHRSHFEYIKGDIISRFYAAIGDKDKAIQWIGKSEELREMSFMILHHHPWIKDLHNSDDFNEIYREAGLFEELFQYRMDQ